ncbi:MAG: type II toxin-antitoxin system VapC family toxin [Candidatus Bathyarchaeia archaeon]
MNAKLIYLDSSSIIKRYIEEKGSEAVDTVYEKAESGKLNFAFSIWNVGEVLGTLDKYFSRKLLTEKEFKTALTDFILESIKMARLDALQILPITAKTLTESWLMVLKHHIYEADALQIAASKEANCNLFLTADKKLAKTATKEGINSINIEETPEKTLTKLNQP